MREPRRPITARAAPLRSPVDETTHSADLTTSWSARDLVAARVAGRAQRFPEIFPAELDTGRLSDRDAALARAVDQAVARRWLTLQAVIRSRLRRSWESLEPQVQAALLVGSAQLLLLERVPDHAAINESVAWIKTLRPAAARIVNAVLRRVAEVRTENRDSLQFRPATQGIGDGHASKLEAVPVFRRDELPLHDGRVLRLAAPVFDDDPLQRLSEQTSHPPELLDRWAQRHGWERAGNLAYHNLVHPPIIVTAPPGLAQTSSVKLIPHDEPGYAVLQGRRSEAAALQADVPEIRVQDPGTAAAAGATADLVPELIVEVCAGQGTKTRQLAALHPQSRIIASDTNPARLETLGRVVAGSRRVLAVAPDRLIEFAGQADLVVVDPPCTNTAVLARRVEARYRVGPRNLERLVKLQRQIIADAIRLLAPAGHLLYSTCSLEPEENEQQVEWILRWHRLRRRRVDCRLPRGLPGDPPTRYSDGCFFAVLRR